MHSTISILLFVVSVDLIPELACVVEGFASRFSDFHFRKITVRPYFSFNLEIRGVKNQTSLVCTHSPTNSRTNEERKNNLRKGEIWSIFDIFDTLCEEITKKDTQQLISQSQNCWEKSFRKTSWLKIFHYHFVIFLLSR